MIPFSFKSPCDSQNIMDNYGKEVKTKTLYFVIFIYLRCLECIKRNKTKQLNKQTWTSYSYRYQHQTKLVLVVGSKKENKTTKQANMNISFLQLSTPNNTSSCCWYKRVNQE